MKLSNTPLSFAALLCLLAAGSTARADLTIEMKHDGRPMKTFTAAHKVAATFETGGMVFLGTEKVLRIYDTKSKKATELTEKDAQAIGAQLADLQKTLESLPPAMREKMQSAMQAKLPGAEEKRAVKPLGQTKTINGFATTGYLVTIDGTKGETEVWAADPKLLGVTSADVAAFTELAGFLSTMLPGLDAMRELIKNYETPDPGDVPGMPVLTIRRDGDGNEEWKSELVRVDHGAVPPEVFAVPTGYKVETMKLGR